MRKEHDMSETVEFIKYITDQFDSNNIIYWLDCGTLLGAYRESNIIHDDFDIDISTFEIDSDKVDKLFEKMLNDGDIKKLEGGKWKEGKLYQLCSLKHEPSLRMDIYVFKKEGLYSHAKFFSDETVHRLKINNKDIEQFSKIKLGDYYFRSPINLDHYLRVRYGKNFMIPQKKCEELNKDWDFVGDNVGDEFLYEY